MRNYVFIVRPWNLSFFLSLEGLILQKEGHANIIWLTMQRKVINSLMKKGKNVHYLPEKLSMYKDDNLESSKVTKSFDIWMNKHYNFGINLLFDCERFRPSQEQSNQFIKSHICTLNKLIPEKSVLVSLTCDHFVYFVSAYLNKMKDGHNFFVQPIGFPLNAQLIMESPWDVVNFRKEALPDCKLIEYIDSLQLAPEKSIHYMKKSKLPSLWESLAIKFKELKDASNIPNNIYTYLEKKRTNILPERILLKKIIPYNCRFINDEDLTKSKRSYNLFYYPLQFEPEMSILAYSPWYKDQLEIIRLISQSMNAEDILLLKENPKMQGIRKMDFYKEIDKFPNVKWAHPKLNSRLIIRNSDKVISITGTATIEAACLGINSMIFGYPPFRTLLKERPISEQKISNFKKILYNFYDAEDILDHLKSKWPQFSKGVLFANYIPQRQGNENTLMAPNNLAIQFYNEVILQ
ncbi:hypothetical protein AAG747_24665 [Rapidithrix thailandica]|uniref:Capsule polysaccharide biosynthesis protein n=1 Tax=Rapidithrix thailandica TaxID=413964 RepID=A0AAW9SB47_9BACT